MAFAVDHFIADHGDVQGYPATLVRTVIFAHVIPAAVLSGQVLGHIGHVDQLVRILLRIVIPAKNNIRTRSEEHTSELQSLMRISYAVFCFKKKKVNLTNTSTCPDVTI